LSTTGTKFGALCGRQENVEDPSGKWSFWSPKKKRRGEKGRRRRDY